MNTLDLDTLTLAAGYHDPGDEMCVMEAAAFIAGEEWSDSPECASPVVGAFMRAWNDALNDDDRQDLKRYILRLVGSKGTPEQEDLRGWMALDWLVRVHAPAWLRLAGLGEHADRLAGFAEIRPDTVRRVKHALDAVLEAARATRITARDTAWCPAWDAAMAATIDAAWVATGDAAWGVALDAAWDAAWAAEIAADTARAAAAAWAETDAAWATAEAAARAARAAARAALEPTRRELQQSAHELADRMLAVTEGDPA